MRPAPPTTGSGAPPRPAATTRPSRPQPPAAPAHRLGTRSPAPCSPTRAAADQRASVPEAARAPPAPPGRSRAGNEGPSPPGPPRRTARRNPSATEPLTTASGRSNRFTTDAMARPDQGPDALDQRRARLTRRRARSSQRSPCPTPPLRGSRVRRSGTARPSGSTITWPMCPALPNRPVEQPAVQHDAATDPGRHDHRPSSRCSPPPRRPSPRPTPAPWRRCRRTSAGRSARRAAPATETHATPRCSAATPRRPRRSSVRRSRRRTRPSGHRRPTPATTRSTRPGQVTPQAARRLPGSAPVHVVPGRHRRPLDQGSVQADQPGWPTSSPRCRRPAPGQPRRHPATASRPRATATDHAPAPSDATPPPKAHGDRASRRRDERPEKAGSALAPVEAGAEPVARAGDGALDPARCGRRPSARRPSDG